MTDPTDSLAVERAAHQDTERLRRNEADRGDAMYLRWIEEKNRADQATRDLAEMTRLRDVEEKAARSYRDNWLHSNGLLDEARRVADDFRMLVTNYFSALDDGTDDDYDAAQRALRASLSPADPTKEG